jgi:uncharacterized protein YodC (DUF2158 family)
MFIPLPIIVLELFNKILGPRPKFKRGDSVQCVSNNDLMVVQWVKIFRKSMVMYYCKWYDPKTKSTRANIFKEEQLKQFDWYHQDRVSQA